LWVLGLLVVSVFLWEVFRERERERSNGLTSSFSRFGMEMGTGENGGAS